jgi:hypothetical protein
MILGDERLISKVVLLQKESLKPTKTHYPSNPKPCINPKRGVKKYSNSKRGSLHLHVLWPCGSLG